jgi:hypothetical protein
MDGGAMHAIERAMCGEVLGAASEIPPVPGIEYDRTHFDALAYHLKKNWDYRFRFAGCEPIVKSR